MIVQSPEQPRTVGTKTCRRCKRAEPAARFDQLARKLCRECRSAEIDARPARFALALSDAPPLPGPATPARNTPHLAFVRAQPCAARVAAAATPGLKPCLGITHAHHVRIATGAGMGMKPDDMWCVPLCGYHHAELHTRGAQTFAARYGVDLRAMAERLATRSPALSQDNQAKR